MQSFEYGVADEWCAGHTAFEQLLFGDELAGVIDEVLENRTWFWPQRDRRRPLPDASVGSIRSGTDQT